MGKSEVAINFSAFEYFFTVSDSYMNLILDTNQKKKTHIFPS